MATNIKKEKLLEEDIETGFGVSSQTRGGNRVNADSIPYSSTATIKQALDNRLLTTESDSRYARKTGDSAEEFLVGQGSSPSRAVQKTELDNAPFAKTGGDTVQPFLVADATLGKEATNRDITQDMINDALVPFAKRQDVLEKTNTAPFTPTQPYHPSTKGYVDSEIAGMYAVGSVIMRTDTSNPTILFSGTWALIATDVGGLTINVWERTA